MAIKFESGGFFVICNVCGARKGPYFSEADANNLRKYHGWQTEIVSKQIKDTCKACQQ